MWTPYRHAAVMGILSYKSRHGQGPVEQDCRRADPEIGLYAVKKQTKKDSFPIVVITDPNVDAPRRGGQRVTVRI